MCAEEEVLNPDGRRLMIGLLASHAMHRIRSNARWALFSLDTRWAVKAVSLITRCKNTRRSHPLSCLLDARLARFSSY
jgi:hypothetical protein